MKQYFFYNFSGRTGPDYTKDSFNTMHVLNGTILRTGFNLNMPSGNSAAIPVNLKNSVVLPAFSDSHVHFLQTGISLLGCQLQDCNSLDDIYDSLSSSRPIDNNWRLGWNLDESKLMENRFPTINELDKVDSSNKVWLARKDLHSAVLNSKAMIWAKNIIPGLSPVGGRIFGENYNKLSYELLKQIETSSKFNSLKLVEEVCFKNGVAYVHALEGSSSTTSDVSLTRDFFSDSNLDAVIYHQSSNPGFAVENKLKQLGGCILVDGSIGTRTAATFESYSDQDTTGEQYLLAPDIEALLATTNKHNLQLALHAIGDKAIETVASCYAWARDKFGDKSPRNRIEHFIMPTENALIKTKQSQSMVCIQPAFDYFWGGKGGLYEQRLGKIRSLKCNPFRTMIDIGIQIAAGSDSPVTPIDPMLGIHSLVNHSNPDERIGLNNAFSMFISEPHKLTFKENNRGQLKKGFLANFTCFSEDPLAIARNKIKFAKPKSLYIRGKRV